MLMTRRRPMSSQFGSRLGGHTTTRRIISPFGIVSPEPFGLLQPLCILRIARIIRIEGESFSRLPTADREERLSKLEKVKMSEIKSPGYPPVRPTRAPQSRLAITSARCQR
jgi:hypothetical protein